MGSKKLRKNKEAARRVTVRVDRTEDAKEGDMESKLRAAEISKARSRPLSIASQTVLREEEHGRTAEAGFSGYFRNKHKDEPSLSHLPTDNLEARKFAITSLRPTPIPTDYWLQLPQ